MQNKPEIKKTKIVATIGPATESAEMLEELLVSGLNVMRLNFSHGSFEEHGRKIVNLRKAEEKTGIHCAVLQDLSGPKFRIGEFKEGKVILKEGETIVLTPEQMMGDATRVYINYPTLAKELKVGNIVMLDDGKKKLEVTKIVGKDVVCKIIVGGETKGKRGVNLPGAYLKVSSLTDKDKEDLKFGVKNEVDFVAFSFVRTSGDVQELRDLLNKAKCQAKIISKIETQEAVENFEEILALSDGIMVARGDMAVEIGAENVPAVQKMIIRRCNEVGKPVITATQMLESMIQSPVPTRAEVSDIANAILDGTDAVMLSEETTLGKFPVEAVRVMARVALRMENDYLHKHLIGMKGILPTHEKVVADAVTSHAVRIADCVSAEHIVAFTQSGFSARMISRHKPHQYITALTPERKTYNQAMLSFGVTPVLVKKISKFEEVMKLIREHFLVNKLAEKGEKIVIVTGLPFGKVIDTNTVLVETL